MTQVLRYEDDGTPVMAPESGELEILWNSLAVLEEKKLFKNDSSKCQSFSIDEFFKRLYMARAELDICSATLELIDKPALENIELKAAQYQQTSNNFIFDNSVSAKKYSIMEAAAKLRNKAAELENSCQVEHEIVSSVLLKLRRDFFWNIIRITSLRQVTIYFDPSELTPIAAVNFSPLLLFKESGERYLTGDQLNPINLAIIFRDCTGKLILKLQDSDDSFKKFLKITTESELYVVDCKLQVLASDDIDTWDSILQKARFALIVRLILGLIEKEAGAKDVVISDSNRTFIMGKHMSLNWDDSEMPEGSLQSLQLHSLFKNWYSSFLESAGTTINYV